MFFMLAFIYHQLYTYLPLQVPQPPAVACLDGVCLLECEHVDVWCWHPGHAGRVKDWQSCPASPLQGQVSQVLVSLQPRQVAWCLLW